MLLMLHSMILNRLTFSGQGRQSLRSLCDPVYPSIKNLGIYISGHILKFQEFEVFHDRYEACNP